MALSTRVQGAPRPAQVITWLRGGDEPEDLSGATLTGVLYPLLTGETRAITGTLTVTEAAAGVFTWEPSVADVAEAGRFRVQFSAAYPTGLNPARTLGDDWEVRAAYAVPEGSP